MAPTLASVPPELFDKIDLKSIRLVSRECAAKVFNIYSSTLFSEIVIRPQLAGSLKAGLGIVAQPTFAKCIRTISVDIGPRENEKDDNPEPTTITSAKDVHLDSLEVTFTALRNTTARFPEVRITGASLPDSKPGNQYARPLASAFQALRKANPGVESFRMSFPFSKQYLEYALPLDELNNMSSALYDFRHILQTLRSLEMMVWQDDRQWRKGTHAPFIGALKSAPLLEHLKLTVLGRIEDDNEYGHETADHCSMFIHLMERTFKPLKHFHIRGGHLCVKFLVEFLEMNKLQKLCLQQCDVRQHSDFDLSDLAGMKLKDALAELSKQKGMTFEICEETEDDWQERFWDVDFEG